MLTVNTRKLYKQLRLKRWKNKKRHCPFCNCRNTKISKRYSNGKQIYYCPKCRKEGRYPFFNDFSKTPFERLRIKEEQFFLIMHYFIGNCSAKQAFNNMERIDQKCNLKTISRYYNIFREIIRDDLSNEKAISSDWEIDELYIGVKGTYRRKRKMAGRGTDQLCILNMVSRGEPKQVKFAVIQKVTKKNIQKEIFDKIGVKNLKTAYTDQFRSYLFLKNFTNHFRVNHTKNFKEPNTNIHTNTVESINSYIRDFILKKYRCVSIRNIKKYLYEAIWKLYQKKKEKDLLRLCFQ